MLDIADLVAGSSRAAEAVLTANMTIAIAPAVIRILPSIRIIISSAGLEGIHIAAHVV
jgi:hypothetical protein